MQTGAKVQLNGVPFWECWFSRELTGFASHSSGNPLITISRLESNRASPRSGSCGDREQKSRNVRAVFDLTKLLHLQNQALLDEVDLGSKRSLADPTKVNFGAAICRRSGTGTPLRFYLPVYATLPPPLAMFELNCRADHACVTSAWSGLL